MKKQHWTLSSQYLDLEARVNINIIVSEFKRMLQFFAIKTANTIAAEY